MSLSSVKSRTQKRKLDLTSDFDAQSNTNQPPPTPSEGLDGPAIERTASSDSDGPPHAGAAPPASKKTKVQKEGSSTNGRYVWEPSGPSRKNESDAWEHYKKDKKYNAKGKRVGVCLYCGAEIVGDGTSSLRLHTKRCKQSPFKVTLDSFFPNEGSEKTDGSGAARPPFHQSVPKFDQAICRKELVRLFIIAELPFRFVENEAFRQFLKVLQPRFEVHSRRTLTRDVLKMYGEEKERLGNVIRNVKGKVCLTTDLWTSCQKYSYMSLTAHFIDDKWKLHKKILNFAQVNSHTGENVGRVIKEKLIQWNIGRVLSITVDNASSNNVTVSYLKKWIMSWDQSCVLNGDYMHMRCCAHILNLIVRDGLDGINESISRIRGAVKYVRGSTTRFSRFKTHAKSENITSERVVCLDVDTRWNSTYKMLDAALIYRKVFQRLETEEVEKYTEELEKGDGVPTDVDWNHVRSILPFLKAFYNATVRMSGSSYVTASTYMAEVSSIGLAINKHLSNKDVLIKNMAAQMKLKFRKYWGDANKVNMLLMIALVLDPRQKMFAAEYYFVNFFEPQSAAKLEMILMDSLKVIFEQYKELTEGSINAQPMHIDVDDDDDDDDYTNAYWQATGNTVQSSSLSELEKYLKEDREPYKKENELDLLNWWKVNENRFPVLASIAKDVLAIPVSTVASESAFSTGGRVLSEYRSCLDPKTAESLICTQDWLRGSQFTLLSDEDFEELEKFQNEFSQEEKAPGISTH